MSTATPLPVEKYSNVAAAGKTMPQSAGRAVQEKIAAMARGRKSPYGLLPLLLFFLELLYLLIVALSSLPQLHLSTSPLATAWPWTLLPLRLLFPTSGTTTELDWPYLALLSITLVSLVGIYALAVRGVKRWCDTANT